jgi:Amidohydrolase family
MPPSLSRRDALMTSLFSLSALAAPNTTDRFLVFDHVNVVDGSGRVLPDQTVVVEGKRIASVGPAKRRTDRPKAHVVDGTGKYLMPGLWDMHVHLSYTKSSALPILLANGVTGVRDCGGLLHEIDEWQTQVSVGTLSGPQIIRAGPQVNGKVFAFTQIAVLNNSEARGAVKALHIAGVDFIKVVAAISRDAYFGVAQECKALGLPFAGHIPRVLSPAECSDAGQVSLEHIDGLFDGKIPGSATSAEKLNFIKRFRRDEAPGLFSRFAQNHTYYTPTLLASAYPYLTRLAALRKGEFDPRAKYVSRQSRELTDKLLTKYSDELKPTKIEAERQPFQEYLELVAGMNRAGVPLLAGTDLATSVFYPGFSLHDELQLLVRAGLTPAAAIATATRNPASLLGLADLGTIATGKIANMVLLDQNPLADIANTARINSVVYEGKLLNRAALDLLLKTGAEMAATS